MTSQQIITGIDCRFGRYYVAQVKRDSSERKVTALMTAGESSLREKLALEGTDVVFAVPDNRVVVKNLRLRDTARWDADLLAQFELSQSLLDDEAEFCFATLSTGSRDHRLGLVTRQRNLAEITDPLLPSSAAAMLPKYKMRAVALGKGYIAFCHAEQGGLVCLVDFRNDVASISFVLEGNILDVAGLAIGQFNPDTECGLKTIAAELKTVVNFRMASLLEGEEKLPLSTLLISGCTGNSPIRTVLEHHFQIPVMPPRINKRWLAESPALTGTALEDYLIAMGLTVN